LSKKQLYTTIYNRLIQGQTLTKLAASIGYDKGYVSRIKEDLVQAGFLIPTNPKCRTKFYSATKKVFTGEKSNLISNLTGGVKQQFSHRLNVVKIQKATFLTDIKSGPDENLKWDKVYQYTPYVSVYEYVYPFANVGNVRFRRFKGTKNDRLLIITPPMNWELDSGDPKEFMEQTARHAAGWIQKRFKMKLENLHPCQKPHYAKTLTDPRLIHAAQNGSFNIDGLMVDASAPDEVPEIESEDWEVINALSKAPERIRSLEYRFSKMEGMMVKLIEQQEKMTGMLHDFISQPSRPDTFRDVV